MGKPAPVVKEIYGLLQAQAVPMAIVLWVQEGCEACHFFHKKTYVPAAGLAQEQGAEIPFFVIDSASHKPGSFDADEAKIEATPTVTIYAMGEEQRRIVPEGPMPPQQFLALLMEEEGE